MPDAAPKALIYPRDSRAMPEISDSSIALVVTSPPYWHIKDYGCAGQIGHGQSLHNYLHSLACVWRECTRVLRGGGRLCVNIGDQFARATVYGRYRVIPLHAEIIRQCELLDLDFMGSIIWQKKTTVNTTGGAPVMGSFPFPPNGIVELDYEHILIFKKPGASVKTPPALKKAARMTTEEWKTFFSGHWSFAGARKAGGHEAAFPEELPRRLIRMFSFPGDTVLDPFLGTGTTAMAAVALGRRAVGFEINPEYVKLSMDRLGRTAHAAAAERIKERPPRPVAGYEPGIRDANPPAAEADGPELHTVASVSDDLTLVLDDGRKVGLRGVRITDADGAREYLRTRVVRRKVILKDEVTAGRGRVKAFVYLKNKIFVNGWLISSGAGVPDGTEHRLSRKMETLKKARARR